MGASLDSLKFFLEDLLLIHADRCLNTALVIPLCGLVVDFVMVSTHRKINNPTNACSEEKVADEEVVVTMVDREECNRNRGFQELEKCEDLHVGRGLFLQLGHFHLQFANEQGDDCNDHTCKGDDVLDLFEPQEEDQEGHD
jgi:hypothetical protein